MLRFALGHVDLRAVEVPHNLSRSSASYKIIKMSSVVKAKLVHTEKTQ